MIALKFELPPCLQSKVFCQEGKCSKGSEEEGGKSAVVWSVQLAKHVLVMLHCSKSQFTCVLVLYTSITASPLHLPWARQGMWALCCESDKQDKSSPAGPGPLLLLCQSTGLASASFQKCPFEVLSFCQACRCLAAQLEIVRRWRANSLDGCEVLKKGN